MASQDPHALTPATRSAALLVARVIFYNGLLIGLVFCVAMIAVVFFHAGRLATSAETWLVGAVLVGLAILSFAFSWSANSRIERLKKSA